MQNPLHRSLTALAVLLAALSACAEEVPTSSAADVVLGADAASQDTSETSDTSGDNLAGEDADAPAGCAPAEPWQPGAPIFVEVTDDWGLTGITGHTFSVVDYDGDGW